MISGEDHEMSKMETHLSAFHIAAVLAAAIGSAAPARAEAGAVAAIKFEAGACLGKCPVYAITLRSDGTCTYEGGHYAPRSGEHQGRIHPSRFQALVRLIEMRGFFRMKPEYRSNVTDGAMKVLSVLRGGKSYTVESDVAQDHLAFWELELAVNGLATEVEWTPTGMKLPDSSEEDVRALLLERVNQVRRDAGLSSLIPHGEFTRLAIWDQFDNRGLIELGPRITARFRGQICGLDPLDLPPIYTQVKATHIGVAAQRRPYGWCVVLWMGTVQPEAGTPSGL